MGVVQTYEDAHGGRRERKCVRASESTRRHESFTPMLFTPISVTPPRFTQSCRCRRPLRRPIAKRAKPSRPPLGRSDVSLKTVAVAEALLEPPWLGQVSAEEEHPAN